MNCMNTNTAMLNQSSAIEEVLEASAQIAEKIVSAFNFVGPRGTRKDFCSDCCGSNGNDCVPQ
jgi:hypothetical protein